MKKVDSPLFPFWHFYFQTILYRKPVMIQNVDAPWFLFNQIQVLPSDWTLNVDIEVNIFFSVFRKDFRQVVQNIIVAPCICPRI